MQPNPQRVDVPAQVFNHSHSLPPADRPKAHQPLFPKVQARLGVQLDTDRKPLNQLKIARILGSDRVAPIGKRTITVTMDMDEFDFKTLLEETKEREKRSKALGLAETLLPDGDSDETGAIVAECIRDLNEYRQLSAAREREAKAKAKKRKKGKK